MQDPDKAPSTQPRPGQPGTRLDRAIEDSFPASDPPAHGGITGPADPPRRNTEETPNKTANKKE